jgi:hypothetical protein
MTLDLRKPIAVLFLLLGALLAGYGIAFPGAHAEVVTRFNVNLIWGAAMITFAGLLFGLSLRAARHAGSEHELDLVETANVVTGPIVREILDPDKIRKS